MCQCIVHPLLQFGFGQRRSRRIIRVAQVNHVYRFLGKKKAGELTEDDQKKLEEETQKLTDKYVKLIDDTCADKNKEIMEV